MKNLTPMLLLNFSNIVINEYFESFFTIFKIEKKLEKFLDPQKNKLPFKQNFKKGETNLLGSLNN